MGYPTSAATAYSTDDKARDIQKLIPCTQSVSVSSNGTSYFAPTFPAVPKNCVIVAKDQTAGVLLGPGYHCSVLSSNRITFIHDAGAKRGSARATVYY